MKTCNQYTKFSYFKNYNIMITFSPVKGQIPPFARVAAITLPASQFVSVEQVYEKILLPFELITVEILGKLRYPVYDNRK